MISPRAILVLVALAASHASAGEAYRDDLAVPAYRLLASMLAQFRDEAPAERAERSVELVAPLVRALDDRHRADVEQRLRRAIRAHDREAAFCATMLLVLLDAEDLLEGIRRDDYTGWSDARVLARRAFLDYRLVTADLRRTHAELDRRTVADFGRLAGVLDASDLATSPVPVVAARAAAVADLAALRATLDREAPARTEKESR